MRSGHMMNRMKQRGSIEVVILIIVFAVVIGLIVWRYTEAEKAQMDADNAANSSEIDSTPAEDAKQRVEVPEMSLAFEVPQSAGEITYDVNESGAAQLKSSKLVDRSDCEEDHDGKFALLRTANAGDAEVDDNLKMRIDNAEYVVQEDYQTCYSDEDRTEFDEVSIAIAQSLTRLEAENGARSTNPDEPVSSEE